MKLKDKVALITGGSVGIGRATAELFAREGAKVAVNSQSPRGREVAEQIQRAGGQAMFVQGRVDHVDDAQSMVHAVVERFGRLDILFNNAGIVLPGRVDNTSVQDWDRTMAVNCRGVFLMSQFAVRQMLKQGGGVVIHNASVAAAKGLKDRAAYSASKGAITALTRAMAADHVDQNIRVNCVNPGTTLTPSLQDRINAFNDPQAAMKTFIARQPMGRLGKPEEIAASVLFLACDDAAFITGQCLNVDGGLTM